MVCGDADYYSNYLSLHHFNSLEPCFRCKANRSTCPWSDFRREALWRSAPRTQAEWFFAQKHVLFKSVVLGLGPAHVAFDVLHCIDLGIALSISGGVLYLLSFRLRLPGSLDDRLSIIWEEMVKTYTSLGTPAGERLPRLVFKDLWEHRRSGHPETFPELHCKAAVSRHCLIALSVVLSRLPQWAPHMDGLIGHAEGQDVALAHCILVVQNLRSFYDGICFHPRRLPDNAAAELNECLGLVGIHYQALVHMFATQGEKIFRLTLKMHFTMHIGLDMVAHNTNPRWAWTYQDEDYVGRIAQVAAATMRARGPLKVGGVLFLKWRHVVYIRWSRRAV